MLVIVIAVASLAYSGLCFTRLRFLSDQEAFDAAIAELIQVRGERKTERRGARARLSAGRRSFGCLKS
jgi:predicted ATPase